MVPEQHLAVHRTVSVSVSVSVSLSVCVSENVVTQPRLGARSSDSTMAGRLIRAVVCEAAAADAAAAAAGLLFRHVPAAVLDDASAVRICVRAAGTNLFDLLQMTNKYQVKMSFPFTPGAEVAGDVVEVGSEVSRLRVGDSVMCTVPFGGMAEEVVVPEASAVTFPRSLMTYDQAAAVPVGFMTAFHGLVQRGALKRGETVVVTGASGGMGVAAIRLASQLGARVIAAVSSPTKFDTAKAAGADVVCTYEQLKDTVAAAGSDGVDVAYDVVGGDVFNTLSRLMAPEGRLLVVGFASGTIPQLRMNLPLVKGYSVVGVRSGAEMIRRADYNAAMLASMESSCAAGKFVLPTVPYPVAKVCDAYASIVARTAQGKVVIVFSEPSKL